MDGKIRNCLQRSNVGPLTLALPHIWGPRSHQRSEVSDAVNRVSGQESPAQKRDVEPPQGGAFECTVVEIESVDVDVRAHKSRGPFSRGPRAQSPKLLGGLRLKYSASIKLRTPA